MGLRHIAAITLVGLAGALASSSEAATPALYKNCTNYPSLGVARSAIDHLRPRPAPQRRTLEPSRTMFVAAAVATGAVSIAVSAQAVATATPQQIILKKADLGWNAGPTGSYSSRDILQQQDHAYPRGPRPLDGYIAAFRTKKMAMNVFVATALLLQRRRFGGQTFSRAPRREADRDLSRPGRLVRDRLRAVNDKRHHLV